MTSLRSARALSLLAVSLAGACIPYTAATTAAPVPEGRARWTTVYHAAPLTDLDSSRHGVRAAVDADVRFGLTHDSDVGVRIPSASGIVVNYKQLVSDTGSRVRVAVMPGFGFVNMFEHAHFEMSLLVSGRDEPMALDRRGGSTGARRFGLTPYGGIRVMQVAPLTSSAVHDRPTAGGFVGLRIYNVDFGISPEVGVFYDHSVLGLRRSNIVIVPAISIHRERDADAPPPRTRPRTRRPFPTSIPRLP